jgi:hypothetical protein
MERLRTVYRHLRPKKRELAPRKNAFLCPRCNYRNSVFSAVCPACGRPFIRDYIDFRMHPRDPDLTATLFHDPFWARIWFILFVASFFISLALPF